MPEHFKPREPNVESPYVLSMVVSKHSWKGWEVTQEDPSQGKESRTTQVRRKIEGPREVSCLQDALEGALFMPPVPAPQIPGKGEGPDVLQGSQYQANMYFERHVFMFSPLKTAWERLAVI